MATTAETTNGVSRGRAAARGRLVVISAPSGAGKTTIAREILGLNPSLQFSVSATTRPRRAGEQNGKDYFFLTPEEFARRVAQNEFVEWEEIYGHRYGTLKTEVDRALQSGKHLLFDVDVKGGLSIKRRYPQTLMIFIMPPSIEILRQRLRDRRTEDDVAFARRMERVAMEIETGRVFQHRCVNDDLARAVGEVNRIVKKYLQTS